MTALLVTKVLKVIGGVLLAGVVAFAGIALWAARGDHYNDQEPR